MIMSTTQPFSSVDQMMGTQSTGMGIANTMWLSRTPSSPMVDDAQQLLELPRREDKKPEQSVKRSRAVLAPRWSEKHGTVMIVDFLTGEVKAAWRPKNTPQS